MLRLALPALAFAAISSPASATEPAAGYRLVWSDEFAVDGRPDPAKWSFETGFKRNGEMQWYQPDNAFVRGGVLVIEARRERRPSPSFGNLALPSEFARRRFINFTSASVNTRGLHSWLYGRFEVRAKITAGPGLWPAIWTLGVDGKWPANGEVDILEYYQDSILANFAWAESAPNRVRWQATKRRLAELTGDPKWSEQFHVWSMDWSEHEIVLRLDGKEMNRLDLDRVRNHPATGVAHPFRQPHYLLLNLALGGQRGGPLAKTHFPSRFEIDYVRVYQRPQERKPK